MITGLYPAEIRKSPAVNYFGYRCHIRQVVQILHQIDPKHPFQIVGLISALSFRKIKKSGEFDFLEHANNTEISSWDASLKVLGIFKHWVEDNRGWDLVIETTTRKREKAVQSLIHLSGLQYCKDNNIDMSFEANEGPGPIDLKISRGNDKIVIEVKLSSNDDYLHGYEEQIERYAQAEKTDKRIYVYVQVGNPGRNEKIRKRHEERINGGKNPPLLYMIDSQKQISTSRRA